MRKSISLLLMFSMLYCLLSGCESEGNTRGSSNPEAQSAVSIVMLKETDEKMKNIYSILAVNPNAPFVNADGEAVTGVAINTVGAEALIKWLLSEEALAAAADYGKEQFGDSLFYIKEDTPRFAGKIAKATEETKVICLSTTTSVNDSGLLDVLLPTFEQAYGYTVEVQSAGTGKAIAAAKFGNADLILVHSKSQEETFVQDGFSYVLDGFESERLSFIYNYFVLCGPEHDPAGVANVTTILEAFSAIADGEYTFISRGDTSGTHTKELSLWPENLGITAQAESFESYVEWYISANAGMGECLFMAEELDAYILTDKATFLSFCNNSRAT